MDPYPLKVSKDLTVMITGHKIIPACNNPDNKITAVYICGIDQSGKIQTYERKYTAGWSNGKVYCETCRLINPRCDETTLTDLNLDYIREYDRIHYGGCF
jgi:hypothetical protein